MNTKFIQDPYPGNPKILFIGWPESSHTHSWIDLLNGSGLNARLFALPSTIPPERWKVKTYITAATSAKLDPETRLPIFPPPSPPSTRRGIGNALWKKAAQRLDLANPATIEEALARVIREWRPDIIHTLGLDPAGFFYQRTCDQFTVRGIGRWVAQIRGGPDLALNRYAPETLEKIKAVFAGCDQIIADNQQNYDLAILLGLDAQKIPPLGIVPGTGGMDVGEMESKWSGLPSQRERIIVWPKAYEAPSSKALPVFEALKIAWDKIRPCRIEMLWVVQPEIEMWLQTLPEEIRISCHVQGRLPRQDVLELLSRARVMLAPSLLDGTPNSMLEAMALGAFPIVSPLETITPLVNDPENVFFGRNLYPEELASALGKAMTDNAVIDRAATENLQLVRRIADRSKIAPRVVDYYSNLARKK